MNVDSILISEYAKTTDGRLTVVNTFNRISGPGPQWGVPMLAVSLVIHGHKAEAGTHHEGEIKLLNKDREEINPQPMTFEFQFKEESELDPGMPLRSTQTYTVIGISFPEPGPYAFEVYIDETYHASASLFVQKLEGG